jgi:hypothetical protein
MTSVTDLFKIVTFNDYEKLTKIMSELKAPKINSVKSQQSLISKAIEVRAFECFNLLINSPELTIIYNTDTNLSGLRIAVEYYTNAPNSSNKYYLYKLLEYDINTDEYIVSSCINNSELFDILFSKLEKTKHNMLTILFATIKDNQYNLLCQLYDYLNINNLSFYDTIEKKQIFNNDILREAINKKNIKIITFLKSINHDIMTMTISNGIYIPSIFYVLNYNNGKDKIIFNFYYDIMKNMNLEELNNISHINIFYKIFERNYYNITYIKDYTFKSINQILSLPINWVDLANIITKCYTEILDDRCIITRIEKLQIYIYMMLNTKKVNTNPFSKISTRDNHLKICIMRVLAKGGEITKKITKLFRFNIYILNHFGFDYYDTSCEHIKLLFNNLDNTIKENEKIECIKYFEEIYIKIVGKTISKLKKTKSSNMTEIIV